MAKDCYENIDWNRSDLVDGYEQTFGIRLDQHFSALKDLQITAIV